MHRLGANVSVVTGRGTELERRLVLDGVPVHPVQWTVGLDPRVIARLSGIVRPHDLMHAHDNHAHALADVAARFNGARVIVTRRVAFPLRHPARWQRAAAVIALSRAIADQLASADVPPQRIHVIPPGVPTLDIDSATHHESTPPLLVCIAALTPEKGVHVLLDAMPHVLVAHPDVRLIVAGAGPEHAALQQRADSLGVAHAVQLVGHLPDSEQLLARATVAVQPSLSEGFGSAVVDAMSRGVPVVASDTGGLPDALALGGGVLVAPGEADALAAAIVSLVGDASRRKQIGAEGRAAAARFTVHRLVAATLDVYRSA